MNVTFTECATPSESYAVTVVFTACPTAIEASRLPAKRISVEDCALTCVPKGISMAVSGVCVSTTPVVSAVQPMTRRPVTGFTRPPSTPMSKAPSRVKKFRWPSETTKKPSPWMAKSVSLPVDWIEPCVMIVSMPPRFMPRPICAGFVPPRPFWGELAPLSVWPRMSWNVTRLDL